MDSFSTQINSFKDAPSWVKLDSYCLFYLNSSMWVYESVLMARWRCLWPWVCQTEWRWSMLMIRGWMTFPSVIIPTISHFHPCVHTLVPKGFKTHTNEAPQNKHRLRPRVYLPLTLSLWWRCSLIDWPLPRLLSWPSADLLTWPIGIYWSQRSSWSDCPFSGWLLCLKDRPVLPLLFSNE